MTTLMLTPGDSSDAVRSLQEKLNFPRNRDASMADLPVTGVIDQATIDRTQAFQRLKWLEERDRVDDACWNCLNDNEQHNVLHDVPYIAQPDEFTCFAASLAMMRHPEEGDLTAGSVMGTDYGARHRGGVDGEYRPGAFGFGPTPVGAEALASELRASFPDLFVSHGDIALPRLAGILSGSPLMIYASGHGTASHAMCIVGLRGNHTSEDLLTLRLYDPWSSTRSYWRPGQTHGIRSTTLRHLRDYYALPFYVWACRERF
jgi:hypothetical protein